MESSSKKILNQGPFSGIAVPLAIVLVGAGLIFGITKMLSTGKDYKDLVTELNSKTFGNRWVAAYELSKYLAASKIPEADKPWVAQELSEVYIQGQDARTRNFVIMALGLLGHSESYPLINQALEDSDQQVQFSAVVTLGNAPRGTIINWKKLEELLQTSQDSGLKQVIMLSMANHQYPNAPNLLEPYLEQGEVYLKWSALMALLAFPYREKVVFFMDQFIQSSRLNSKGHSDPKSLVTAAQYEAIKLSMLITIGKNPVQEYVNLIPKHFLEDENVKVSTKALEVLNLLKKQ
jgi:hypothetical protein